LIAGSQNDRDPATASASQGTDAACHRRQESASGEEASFIRKRKTHRGVGREAAPPKAGGKRKTPRRAALRLKDAGGGTGGQNA